MRVLDASVVVKWFVDEEHSDKALQLREEYYAGEREIIVPDLLLFEVANALRYNSAFETEEIKECVETLSAMCIEIVTPSYSLLERAIHRAREFDITCYDATYLALAEDLEFEFITADRRLYGIVQGQITKAKAIRLLAHRKG